MFGRRRVREPARKPHPDPRIEAELQRVLSIQAAVRRKNEAADEAIKDAAYAMERSTRLGSYNPYECHELAARGTHLREVAASLEAEVGALHDDIARRLLALGDDSLFLTGGH